MANGDEQARCEDGDERWRVCDGVASNKEVRGVLRGFKFIEEFPRRCEPPRNVCRYKAAIR